MPVPTAIRRLQWHLSTLPLQLSWVPPAQQSGRKLAVEKLRNKCISWVCLCRHGGDFAVTGLLSCHVTHGTASADPGPPSRWEMASTVCSLRLMFCGTVGQNGDVCWCAGGMTDLFLVKSVPRSPLVWRVFPGWHRSISLHFFRSAEAIFLYFKICCCPWNTCCFKRQTETVVKANSGLSTLLSARDFICSVLELKTPHPVSKLVPFPACSLKPSACFSGFLQGTAVSYCKMSQDW